MKLYKPSILDGDEGNLSWDISKEPVNQVGIDPG